MALVLAVLILAIVSIAASSAVVYTLSSQKDAASKKSGVTA
jgi:Na+-transporting methylmalonyl-CoA/oxaloacetate decarboxylase gamma subunit